MTKNLIKDLRCEAVASEHLHPGDSSAAVMRQAADWIDDHSPALTEDNWTALQEMLNALGDLPGVFERVEAYMLGRGIDDPRAEIKALQDLAFASEPVTVKAVP